MGDFGLDHKAWRSWYRSDAPIKAWGLFNIDKNVKTRFRDDFTALFLAYYKTVTTIQKAILRVTQTACVHTACEQVHFGVRKQKL